MSGFWHMMVSAWGLTGFWGSKGVKAGGLCWSEAPAGCSLAAAACLVWNSQASASSGTLPPNTCAALTSQHSAKKRLREPLTGATQTGWHRMLVCPRGLVLPSFHQLGTSADSEHQAGTLYTSGASVGRQVRSRSLAGSWHLRHLHASFQVPYFCSSGVCDANSHAHVSSQGSVS